MSTQHLTIEPGTASGWDEVLAGKNAIYAPKPTNGVIVWRQVNDFSEREKAALAWAEALTRLDTHPDLSALCAEGGGNSPTGRSPR